MKIYFLPGSCSLATKISLTEAGQSFEAIAVDRATKKAADGKDFLTINPKGYVPTLVLDDGTVLTENPAVLAYVGSLDNSHTLAPKSGSLDHYRLLEWLGYINSEVHKNLSPIFRPDTSDDAKAAARALVMKRLGYIEEKLGAQPYLTGNNFTVADAYLYVTLSWSPRTGVDLSQLPRVAAFYDRCRQRPSVQQVRKAEGLAA
jgi:glutathione S-transferase